METRDERRETRKIKDFTDLVAWQEANKFAVEVYKISKTFPKEESFGLVSQIRRAAVSITSNIAEGFGRFTYPEKANFYNISRGSLAEVQSQFFIALGVGYISKPEFDNIYEKSISINRLIGGLISKTRTLK